MPVSRTGGIAQSDSAWRRQCSHRGDVASIRPGDQQRDAGVGLATQVVVDGYRVDAGRRRLEAARRCPPPHYRRSVP